MIDRMQDQLLTFQGDATRVRCFVHVVNLVAKSVITQFDLPKKKSNSVTAHAACKKRSAIDSEELDEDEVAWIIGSGDDASEGTIEEVLAGGDADVAAALVVIRCLAGNLDDQLERERDEEAPEERVNDGEDDGWIDERWSMDPEELKELATEVMPARRMLVKVSYTVGVCGSTLPAYRRIILTSHIVAAKDFIHYQELTYRDCFPLA